MTKEEIEKLYKDMNRCQKEVKKTTDNLNDLFNRKSQIPERDFLIQFEKILKQRKAINSEFDEITMKFNSLKPDDF